MIKHRLLFGWNISSKSYNYIMVLTGCIYEPVPRLVQCSLFIFGFPSYASLHNDLSRPNTTLASMQDLIILDNAVHQPMHAQN